MIGPAVAALALAAALFSRESPRCRIDRPDGCGGWMQNSAAMPARRAAIGCAMLCSLVAVTAVLPVTVVLAVIALGATIMLRRRGASRRRRRADEACALESALDILAAELRIGAHPVAAFETAAGEASHRAVAAGLRAVAARARLGADIGAGLRYVAVSSALPEHWRRLAVYWELGSERGLAIATLAQAAQRDIAERRRFSAQLDSSMAGARASAAILAGLPALGTLLGQSIGAAPLAFLSSNRGGGPLGVGVALLCGGLLWSDRITGRLT